MRLGNPIPCPEPFTWLLGALEQRLKDTLDAKDRVERKFRKKDDWETRQQELLRRGVVPAAGLREDHTIASLVRELLWKQLDLLDTELAANEVLIRPRATVPGTQKSPRIMAYNLVDEYVDIPRRLNAAVDRLNASEPKRFAAALQVLAREAATSDSLGDLYCSRLEPEGVNRVGVQVAFTFDRRETHVRCALDDVTNFAPTWSVTSVARELLARELQKYAPKDWHKWTRPGLPQMRYR